MLDCGLLTFLVWSGGSDRARSTIRRGWNRYVIVISGIATVEVAMPSSERNDTWIKVGRDRLLLFAVLLAVLLGFDKAVSAGSASASLAVRATVLSSCALSTSRLLYGGDDYSAVNPGADVTANAKITLQCNRGATSTIAIAHVDDASSSAMARGNNRLNYEAVEGSGTFQTWSEVGNGISYLGIAPSAQSQLVSFYSHLTGNQRAPFGSAVEKLVVTINF